MDIQMGWFCGMIEKTNSQNTPKIPKEEKAK